MHTYSPKVVLAQVFALNVYLGMVVFQPTLLLPGLYLAISTLVLLKMSHPCIYTLILSPVY